jgi:hypothetical protein
MKKSRARNRKALYRLILVAFVLWSSSLRAQNQYQFWPEVDTYVKLTSRTRFFFIAIRSNDKDTNSLNGEFGPNFDFYLRPFVRVRLRDKDPAKSKFLTFRIGYRYLYSIRGDDPHESRPITELTSRFYLPFSVLCSDRNRADFRFVEDKPFSWRYRNRITLERNFSIRQYQFTPYLKGELFYDGRYDKIAKNIFTIGSVFPTSKRTEFEIFYEDQRDSSSPTDYHTRGVGLVFSLYF